MKNVAFIVLVAALTLLASPAGAIPRTFVSANGAGNTCSRDLPCANFGTAQAAMDPGGEINCLDSGEFGNLSITKSMTIDCSGVVATVVGGIGISAPDLTVRLRGLTFQPPGLGYGVATIFPGTIFVERCTFLSFVGSEGINLGNTGLVRLFVSDTAIFGNTIGISVRPQTGGSARITVDRVRLEQNGIGISLNGPIFQNPPAPGGLLIAHVRDSTIAGSTFDGIRTVASAGRKVSATLDRTAVTLNDTGIEGGGAQTFVILGRSTVLSNRIGLTGGSIHSYQNNHVTGNATDGAPTNVLSVK